MFTETKPTEHHGACTWWPHRHTHTNGAFKLHSTINGACRKQPQKNCQTPPQHSTRFTHYCNNTIRIKQCLADRHRNTAQDADIGAATHCKHHCSTKAGTIHAGCNQWHAQANIVLPVQSQHPNRNQHACFTATS